MCDINWGPVGQWFSGVVSLGTLGYVLFREQILDRRKRPNLLLSLDLSQGYTDQKDIRMPDGKPDPRISRWIRVQVQNQSGRRVAKNCRAYLIGARVTDVNGVVAHVLQNDVRQLQWMHGNYQPESRDLLPGVVHQVDLAAVFEPGGYLSFRVNPDAGATLPGQYVFTIQVAAEEADSQVCEVTIDWSGTRESLRPTGFRFVASS